MVLCWYAQPDILTMEGAGHMSRMAKRCILTRITRSKITAVFFLLSFLQNNCLADVEERHQDQSQTTDEFYWRIPNLASSGQRRKDSAKGSFTRREQNLRQIADHFLKLAPSSALSIIQDSSDLLHRRSLAGVSPAPGPTQSPPTNSPPTNSPANLFSCGVCGESYTAELFDTLSSVAVYCNVTLDGIISLNPDLATLSNITSKEVKIPCTGTSDGQCTKCGDSAIIKPGDTLDQVSTSCNLTLAAVEVANPDLDYNNIYPGQYITLPCQNGRIMKNVTGCGVCGNKFNVEDDGSVTDVAARCNVSVSQLLEANPAVNSSVAIRQGQSLHVPCLENPANCGPCGNDYIVNEESIQAIAAICRVGIIAITDLNVGLDLTTDQHFHKRVKIPCDSLPPPVNCSQCGPSFSSAIPLEIAEIANTCKVQPEVIAYANSLPLSGVVPAAVNLSIPCAILPARNFQNCGTCGSQFTLESQVTLDQIAGACGTSIAAIRAENANFTFELLGPKDVVNLPCTQPQTGCGPCGNGVTVKATNTVQSVAVQCTTPVARIIQANPNHNFSQPLKAGQVLHIPCGSGGKSGREAAFCLWMFRYLIAPTRAQLIFASLVFQIPAHRRFCYFSPLSFLVRRFTF